MRAGNSGQPAVGARRLRAGLAALGWKERPGSTASDTSGVPDERAVPEEHRALAARLIMSLALIESEQGRANYGHRLLDSVESYVAPADLGTLHLQRGTILMRTGRWREAAAELTVAEQLLGADRERLAATLLNRGVLHLYTGNVRLARNDADRAGAVAAEAGIELIVAMTTHNRGYCDLLIGDIPAALHMFDLAAADYQRLAPGLLHVLETDRAKALLAAGLAADAAVELDRAIAGLRRQRRGQPCAEAELSRSLAALAVGDPAGARRWATTAIRRFRARGNEAWAALAELTRLRASDAASRAASIRPLADGKGMSRPMKPPPKIALDGQRLAERLRGHGLRADAAVAELIVARALLGAGRREDAATQLEKVSSRRNLPLETVLLRQLVRAELAVFDGSHDTALKHVRAGLVMLHTRRGQLGSFDLQTGAASLGAELAYTGLRLVLERGTAGQVFSWLERSRAQAFRVRPVRPPADPEEAAVLAELRQLGRMIRESELNGAPDSDSVSRRNELQRVVRQRSWQASGLGETTAEATPSEVGAALSESGQSYAGILVRDGRLLAVTIGGERVRLVELGDFAATDEAARKLTADLDALAGRKLPARLEVVIRESVRHQTEVLTRHVVSPLLPVLKDDGAVIVPMGALASVPWLMLPGLRGRPVTVAPSASSWLASWRSASSGASRGGKPGGGADQYGRGDQRRQPLLVAGPDLRHAVPEVTELTKIYPGSTALTGADATVENTLRALDGAELAHMATHGHHDRDNVLFSRLDLADGPLMAYDIQRLSTAPQQVILSACDVGRTIVRPGDEILGFTAALLHIGTPTVISSVTRVSDEAAVGLMTAYHRELRKGVRPAEALATASEAEQFCPFVCFGSG
ncbi:MAG TPA: CHAT domain-containing protein [Trebonia sp.]|jgi:tetratricopeptide (TPR) repeat protein|nr:CHAT domain-containing protein [Trebonia sp.]